VSSRDPFTSNLVQPCIFPRDSRPEQSGGSGGCRRIAQVVWYFDGGLEGDWLRLWGRVLVTLCHPLVYLTHGVLYANHYCPVCHMLYQVLRPSHTATLSEVICPQGGNRNCVGPAETCTGRACWVIARHEQVKRAIAASLSKIECKARSLCITLSLVLLRH
jgi:hypothetical protein